MKKKSMSDRKSGNTIRTKKAVQNSFLHYVKGSSVSEFFFFFVKGRKFGHTRNKSQQDDRTSLGGFKCVFKKKKKKSTHGNSEHRQQSQHQKDKCFIHINTKWN